MPTLDRRPEIADQPPLDPEVLIEEARRRQRRRRFSTAGVVAAFLMVAGASWLTAGGGPPAKTRPTSGGGGAANASTPGWHQLTPGAYIGAGAQITTVIGWHGQLLAAGDLFGAQSAKLGCTSGCNPVVWAFRGGRWRVQFAVDADGSNPGATLVATDHGLALFYSAMGTREWTSGNGRTWVKVDLPAEMEAMWAEGIASDGSRVVVSYNNDGGPDLAYGRSDPVFTSTDARHWRLVKVPDSPDWSSIGTTAHGFVAFGTDHADGRALVWSSSDGLNWSAVPAARSPSAFGDLPGDAGVPGHGPDVSSVVSVAHGYVALLEEPDGRVSWSAGGRRWTGIGGPGSSNPYNRDYFPTGVGVDGNQVVFAEQGSAKGSRIPKDATSFWAVSPAVAARTGVSR